MHAKEVLVENNLVKKRREAKMRCESRGCGQERKGLVEPLGNFLKWSETERRQREADGHSLGAQSSPAPAGWAGRRNQSWECRTGGESPEPRAARQNSL